ncbi:MAG: twin-arginine translocase subunit TatC [Endomicrobium sp.]|jgi:sec-independent protein translocase protein TatC|nr:twin-arginine translocase subunit TatC [Endomicrobium sp.]
MTLPQSESGNSQSFLEHFEELRRTLLKCLAAVVLLFIPSFFLAPKVINALIAWSCPPEISELNFFSPMEVFIIQMKLAALLALIISFPYCIWQIWRFLLPALYEAERKALKWWVLASAVLFVLGASFCIAVILPLVMKFSAGFSAPHLKAVIGLGGFLSLAGWLILAFGAMFQFPLAVMLSVRFGLVKRSFLADKRPYIAVIILIISALLTPPDVISQILLSVPAYLLFELGLFLSKGFEKSKTDPEKNSLQKDSCAQEAPSSVSGDGMLDFYISEDNKTHEDENQ